MPNGTMLPIVPSRATRIFIWTNTREYESSPAPPPARPRMPVMVAEAHTSWPYAHVIDAVSLQERHRGLCESRPSDRRGVLRRAVDGTRVLICSVVGMDGRCGRGGVTMEKGVRVGAGVVLAESSLVFALFY
eukprot:FR744423.1.p2 GENE.FR744423.1~~FR744423.1.p2  ORF type:complete len:132 (+),score=1.01 FR744423.1:688-1083(+)